VASLSKITIYTSIPPKIARTLKGAEAGASYQKACINSWKEAGFEVVSLNNECEINELKTRGLNVQLISNGTDSERSSIENFFKLIMASEDRVVAIINADCLLMHYDNFFRAIGQAARESIVLFERLNLAPETMRPTGLHCFGFDGFFFDSSFIRYVDRVEPWLIGQPFWDYWFPLSLINVGARLKMPDAPGLIHVNHEMRWQWTAWSDKLTALRSSILSMRNLDSAFPTEFGNAVRARQTKFEFQNFIFSWLRSAAERIKLFPTGTAGEFLYRFLAGLADSKEQELQEELRQLRFATWGLSKYKKLRRMVGGMRKRQMDPRDGIFE
jgi:hypothetical protein